MMKTQHHQVFEALQVNEMPFWIRAKYVSLICHLLDTHCESLQMSYQKALSANSQLLICIQNHLLRRAPVLLMMISRSSSGNLMP